MENATATSGTCALAPWGLLYTDGIPEGSTPEGEFFSDDWKVLYNG